MAYAVVRRVSSVISLAVLWVLALSASASAQDLIMVGGSMSLGGVHRYVNVSLTGGAVFHKAWWAIIPPGLCVMFVVLACTIIGQTLEEALNPRLRTGHLSVRRFRVLPRSVQPEHQKP